MGVSVGRGAEVGVAGEHLRASFRFPLLAEVP